MIMSMCTEDVLAVVMFFRFEELADELIDGGLGLEELLSGFVERDWGSMGFWGHYVTNFFIIIYSKQTENQQILFIYLFVIWFNRMNHTELQNPKYI